MKATAPTYTGNSADSVTALLVNALMTGSSNSACTPSAWPSTAWFQAGFAFFPPTGGWPATTPKIIWTDTDKGCFGQVTSVPYNAGNSYRFRVYADSTNGNWVIYMLNITTGNASTVIVIGPSTYTLVTNNFNNGVFFENTNANTTWDNQFGSSTLGSVYKYKQNSGSTSWTTWDANTQKIGTKCGGAVTDTVISPNTGHPVSFNLATFSNNYPAC